jgi:hypothetical protein
MNEQQNRRFEEVYDEFSKLNKKQEIARKNKDGGKLGNLRGIQDDLNKYIYEGGVKTDRLNKFINNDTSTKSSSSSSRSSSISSKGSNINFVD